jgi:hypothetical protein
MVGILVHPAVTSDNRVVGVDENGVSEAKRVDTRRDLADLVLLVSSIVIGVRGESSGWSVYNCQIGKRIVYHVCLLVFFVTLHEERALRRRSELHCVALRRLERIYF